MSQKLAELVDGDYTRFRKGLLRDKGSQRQRVFLKAARETDSFLEFMADIRVTGNSETPTLSVPLTEHEFKDPPSQIEQEINALYPLSTVSRAMACRSTFWAQVTLTHLRSGRIESSYLAANGGSLPGGRERIDQALADESVDQNKTIDSCVRAILRRLGGLPEVRGARSVYVDCPLARAWWREHFVTQALQNNVMLGPALRTIVRSSQTYWEKFVDRVIIRSPTFGSENVRSAFLRALAQRVQANPDTKLREQDMQRLSRRAGVYQGSRELSILEDIDLDELMAVVVGEISPKVKSLE
ncbi:MAG: hypothetical protein OXE94_11075 [Aestuariivita sp.]|nr:hypothetical protein [Aestuariivita sp.]MCY4201828.1 hypothetical protein [Aestuariivita sp.]